MKVKIQSQRSNYHLNFWRIVCQALVLSLLTAHLSLAAQLPSLFRGISVSDGQLGVRVVSIEETSQAYLADLRPEDIILRVHGKEVDSIDAFAAVSESLKGRAVSTTIIIFRNGVPREIELHLFSFPILRAWDIKFVPDHDIRFADPKLGLEYWRRLGRGFEIAKDSEKALEAHLNALHNVPTNFESAFKAVVLFSHIGQKELGDGALAEGIRSLHRAILMMERLFNEPLTDNQLRDIRDELQKTLKALRSVPH